MIISIIAAIGQQNELGKDNQLLWHLPNDFKWFKDKTKGHAVIMGRKTFESIGKPLPGRTNIVISRNKEMSIEGVILVDSLESAVQKALSLDETEVFVIGGGQIYKDAIEICDRVYLTHVTGTFEADTFFPEMNPGIWKTVYEEEHVADELHSHNYKFVIYEKK